jgi:hypothetical protein
MRECNQAGGLGALPVGPSSRKCPRAKRNGIAILLCHKCRICPQKKCGKIARIPFNKRVRDCNRALHIAISYHRNTNDKRIFWADLNRLRARKICERNQEKGQKWPQF